MTHGCVLMVHWRGHVGLLTSNWERKWARAPLQEARQQFLHHKCAEDQCSVDHITQEHVLPTRRAVDEQDQLLYDAAWIFRFLSYLSILCDVF